MGAAISNSQRHRSVRVFSNIFFHIGPTQLKEKKREKWGKNYIADRTEYTKN